MATITQEVEVEVEMEAEHVTDYIGELDSEDALELAREVLGAMNSRHCRELAAEIFKEEGEENTGRNCLASTLVEELETDKIVALIKEILDQVDLDTSTCIFEHAMSRVQELKKEAQADEDLKVSLTEEDARKAAVAARHPELTVADEAAEREEYKAAMNLAPLYSGGEL